VENRSPLPPQLRVVNETGLRTLIDAGIDSLVLVPFGKDMVGQLEFAARKIVPLLVR
jgi:hypothetical protein